MKKIAIPNSYKDRLATAAKTHGKGSGDDFAMFLIDKGLKALGAEGKDLGKQIESVCESHGYSSEDEVIEHLLERGLSAYETAETDPEKFKARLRGLGYLD